MSVSHTVLIVEDEPLLRELASVIVEDGGFAALSAENSNQALALLDRHPEIEIVFTDIQLPGPIDGLGLAREINARWPLMEIIVTSGQRSVDIEDLPDHGSFLPKPYTADVLIAALRDAVG